MGEHLMRLFPWPWADPDDRHRALLARAQAGDREAFRSLYQDLYDPVSRFVGRRVRRREDVEDLVGRVFHKLLEHLGDVDLRRGSVRMYVLSIARNAVIDHARARREGTPIDDVAPILADDRATPLDSLVQKERIRALRAAVAALPDHVQEVLALRYGDGLEHAEIAALLGESTAAVKQRLSRAQRSLREVLQEGEVVDVRF
ncbi:sigma-70 family RNA polymerase sigma factor [Polyangium sp. 6x1]|uniref:RNA polymerase sigma factor n=1 Tax=Polyangium sp. 6x1 TaxID=3042689 RepID=UPI00248292C5|nr:sigma-70 family RNA polymerase sigma factor [Polyangium sp. 6x1]MDI1449656.1 sigma-70 family RNA polymerase sigma factor [Polyangium sp. 6x1]